MLSLHEESKISGLSVNTIVARREASKKTTAFVRTQLAALEPNGRPTELQFGSPEWVELDPADPQRTAALLRAALAWHSYCLDTAERIVWQTEADVEAGELGREELRAEWDAEQAEEWKLIARWARGLAAVPMPAEIEAARAAIRPRAVQAAPGWGPIALPGRPGWWRHLIDGRQVDLPYRERTEAAA